MSVWVSSEQVRIMAGPLVGAVRRRVFVVGPGDKKDKAQLLVREKGRLLVLLMAMRTAGVRCWQKLQQQPSAVSVPVRVARVRSD